MNRLATGPLPHIGADGRRRFFVGHFLGSLVLSGVAGTFALKPLGQPMLGWAPGLMVGLVASGVWEVFVYKNVVLRGRGPVAWGLGLLLIFAGVRGAVVGPSQTHPGPAEVAAAILLLMGVWVERHVVCEALGLKVAAGGRTETQASRR